MKSSILTGTPGSGKSFILHALKSQGYGVVEEAATEVIAREQRRGNLEPHLRPDFIDAIVRLQKHRQLEAAMAPSDPQWNERSTVCTLALSWYLGYPPSASLLEELESIEGERLYQRQVLLLQHLGRCPPTSALEITLDQKFSFHRM